jgi:hypothetical protein
MANSAHVLLRAKIFHARTFPQVKKLIIPPATGWTHGDVAQMYIHSFNVVNENALRKDYAQDIKYDTPGTLEIKCIYHAPRTFRKTASKTPLKTSYYIKGPFSRADISLIATCLQVEAEGKFLPQHIGLDFPKKWKFTTETATQEDIWVVNTKLIFKPLTQSSTRNHSYTMDAFRPILLNSVQKGYNPFTIYDLTSQ